MTRSAMLSFSAWIVAVAAFAAPAAAMQEEPDTIFRIEPIEVRVLASTIGMSAPYPVSVIAGSELTRATASAFIEDAVRAVPGVQIHNRYNLSVGERLSIRGFGARSQFGVRGIRILVDGIPATLPDGQATLDHLDLAGLGRVEALRGPASAAYGNAAGGVIHFRTLDPSTQPTSLTARSTVGSHGLWTVEGHATGTSGDVGYRVAVSNMTYDGFRRDPVADDGSVYGGGDRLVVNGTVQVPLAGGDLRLVANAVELDADNPGSLPQAGLDAGQRAAWGFNVRSGATKDVRQGQLGATWNRPIGERDLELDVAGWWIGRDLYNPIPGRVIDLGRNAGGLRVGLQGLVRMRTGTFGWRFGGEAELQSDDRKNFDNDGGQPTDLILDQDERVRALGTFGQARLEFNERIAVVAGARFDQVHFRVDDRFTAGGDPDDSGQRTMNAISPSIGIVFQASERLEIFASASRAFETPTTTELANQQSGAGGFNPFLEPQESITLEAGLRLRVVERLSGEATAFTTDLTNALVPFEVASDPGRTYYRNAGRSDFSGFELSLDGEVARDVDVRAAFTRTNAKYVSFRPDGQVFSGNRIPGLAPRRLDAVVAYAPSGGFVELRGLWQDDVPVDDANSANADSYVLLDFSAGLTAFEVGGLEVSPFFGIANLADTDYVASVVPNAFGDRFFEPGPGRTYRIGMGVTWSR